MPPSSESVNSCMADTIFSNLRSTPDLSCQVSGSGMNMGSGKLRQNDRNIFCCHYDLRVAKRSVRIACHLEEVELIIELKAKVRSNLGR